MRIVIETDAGIRIREVQNFFTPAVAFLQFASEGIGQKMPGQPSRILVQSATLSRRQHWEQAKKEAHCAQQCASPCAEPFLKKLHAIVSNDCALQSGTPTFVGEGATRSPMETPGATRSVPTRDRPRRAMQLTNAEIQSFWFGFRLRHADGKDRSLDATACVQDQGRLEHLAFKLFQLAGG